MTSLDFTKSASRDTCDDRWANWFEGLTITLEEDGDTLLTGPVVDQAALHGLLKKVRDLGMPLVSVNRLGPGQADTSTSIVNGYHCSQRRKKDDYQCEFATAGEIHFYQQLIK